MDDLIAYHLGREVLTRNIVRFYLSPKTNNIYINKKKDEIQNIFNLILVREKKH